MSIAVLMEYPQTRGQWETWAFANMAHHRDINRRIYERGGPNLPESVMDPFDFDDPISWSFKHENMHQQQNAVLGIQGFNLLDVDWNDPEDIQGWISAHANEHYQASTILGI